MEKEAFAAALAEIRARRECLSRGVVFPKEYRSRHTRLQQAGVEALTKPSGGGRRPLLRPAPEAAPRETGIVWIQKPVMRWKHKSHQMEDMGVIEFTSLASLATVRSLIDCFHPLPRQQLYEFLHPTLYVRIDMEDEANIVPADFPCILISALPQSSLPMKEKVEDSLPAAENIGDYSQTIPGVKESKRDESHLKLNAGTLLHTATGSTRVRTSNAIDTGKPHHIRTRQEHAISLYQPLSIADHADDKIRVIASKSSVKETSTSRIRSDVVEHTFHSFSSNTTIDRFKSTSTGITSVDSSRNSVYAKIGIQAKSLVVTSTHIQGRGSEMIDKEKPKVSSPPRVRTRAINAQIQRSVKDIPTTAITPVANELTSRDTKNVSRLNKHSAYENSALIDETRRIQPPTKSKYQDIESGHAIRPNLKKETANQLNTVQEIDPTLKMTNAINQADPGSMESTEYAVSPRQAVNNRMMGIILTIQDAGNKFYDRASMEQLRARESLSMQGRSDSIKAGRNELIYDTSTISAEEDREESSQTESQHPSTIMAPHIETEHDGHPIEIEPHVKESAVMELPQIPNKSPPSQSEIISSIKDEDPPQSETISSIKAEDPSRDRSDLEASFYSGPALAKNHALDIEANRSRNLAVNLNPDFVRSMLDVFINAFENLQSNKPTPLFSMEQIQASFVNYGIRHQTFGLQGIFLAIEDSLTMYYGDDWQQVETELINYIMTTFSESDEGSHADLPTRLEILFRVECILNVVSDILTWWKPTQLRVAVVEEMNPLIFGHQPDQKGTSFRLTPKDHELFSVVHSSQLKSSLGEWIMNGLEIFYMFMYSFLNSCRNTGPGSSTKMTFTRSRQERVEYTIQKLSNMDPMMWKKLDFRFSEIDDMMVLARLKDLLGTFLKEHKTHIKSLDMCAFFPALVAYLSRKAQHISKSLYETIIDQPSTSLQLDMYNHMARKFLLSLHHCIEYDGLDSSPQEVYIRNVGTKVIDMDKINKHRSLRGLSHMNLSAKYSLLTHHQSELMGSAYVLHRKARWDQNLLQPGCTNRYIFHGDASVAVEYVYVRTRVDFSHASEAWEGLEHLSESEIRAAFNVFWTQSLPKGSNVFLGIGINALHIDLLRRTSPFLSLKSLLREDPDMSSISIGYYASTNPDIQAVRVTFRIHADMYPQQLYNVVLNDDGRELSYNLERSIPIMNALNRFLQADDSAHQHLLEMGGLLFLFDCLQENRESKWKQLKCEKDFYDLFQAHSSSLGYPRDEILHHVQKLILLILSSPKFVIKENMKILTTLVVKLKAETEAESKVVQTVIHVLTTLCSNQSRFATNTYDRFSVFALTDYQKAFVVENGLQLMSTAADQIVDLPERKKLLEEGILNLMMTREFCMKGGLLVHWQHWMIYFVEKEAWTASAERASFLEYLLEQIHSSFFKAGDFEERATVYCTCGCKSKLPETLLMSTLIELLHMFVRLILTDKGVMWAQDEMKGLNDILLLLSWTLTSTLSVAVDFQLNVLDALYHFLEKIKSADRCLHFFVVSTPKLLRFLQEFNVFTVRFSLLRVLSLALELSMDKMVWKISLKKFLKAIYLILGALHEDTSRSTMNIFMVSVLFRHNKEWKDNHGDASNKLLPILHEEHMEKGKIQGVHPRSLIQSLFQLITLPADSPIQPFCQVPTLIALGWMMESTLLAEDFADMRLNVVLQELIEDDLTRISILAARVLITFYFQALKTQRMFDEKWLRRLCNSLTVALGIGARMSIVHEHSDIPDNPEALVFSADQQDSHILFGRYSHYVQEQLSENLSTGATGNGVECLEYAWAEHYWTDSRRATVEKVTVFLKLLAVFSSLTTNVSQVKDSAEMKQALILLQRFVRDRVYVAENHVLLYLYSLRNLIFVLRADLVRLEVFKLNDLEFLRKLFQYSRWSSSQLLQELASGVLWALADAYVDTTIWAPQFVMKFVVADESTSNSVSATSPIIETTGVTILSENILSKLTVGRTIEGDAGTLAALLLNPSCGILFIENYGYSFIVKAIDSFLRSETRRGSVDRSLPKRRKSKSNDTLLGKFGPELCYGVPVTKKDKDMIQLCCLAHSCLEAMYSATRAAIGDEIIYSKKIVLVLLDYPNDMVLHQVMWCIIIHLKAQKLRSTDLLDLSSYAKIMKFLFRSTYPPLQAATFKCLRLALGDPSNLQGEYKLHNKLFGIREKVVSCLRNSDFEVTKQVMILLVDLAFVFHDENLLAEFAAVFREPDNDQLLSELFYTLCNDFGSNSESGYVLQLLIRLVIRLNLVAQTNNDHLIEAICLTLRAHKDTTMLRPLLCSCLCQIASQRGNAMFFAKKSRLETITNLLLQRLTVGELKSIGSLLRSLVLDHEGIRYFLSHAASGCIGKITRVLGAFFETSKDGTIVQESPAFDDLSQEYIHAEDIDGLELKKEKPETSLTPLRYVLKIMNRKQVFISHFTDDIYEEFLGLLLDLLESEKFSDERYGCACDEKIGCHQCDPCDLIAKAECGRVILRFKAAFRVPIRSTYDLNYFLSTTGSEATKLGALSLQLLYILAPNHQSRVEILRGYTSDWSWIEWLMKHVSNSNATDISTADSTHYGMQAIMCLGHFCAEKVIVEYLVRQQEFVLQFFDCVAINDSIHQIPQALDLQRASLFTIARLAEYQYAVSQSLFQEKIAALMRQQNLLENDPISLANFYIVLRNISILVPDLQGRIPGESTLMTIVGLLCNEHACDENHVTNPELCLVAADILAHVLFFKSTKYDEIKRPSHQRQRRAGIIIASTPVLGQPLVPPNNYMETFRHFFVQSRAHSDYSAEDHFSEMHILLEELIFVCSLLQEQTIEALLQYLLRLHLTQRYSGNAAIHEPRPDDDLSEVIENYAKPLLQHQRRRCLQYVLHASDRNLPEGSDSSFPGSAHLWMFLLKLRTMCWRDRAEFIPKWVEDLLLDCIPRLIASWSSCKEKASSESTCERRHFILRFVISVLPSAPELLQTLQVEHLIGVIENFNLSRAVYAAGYEVLLTLCQQRPECVTELVAFFAVFKEGTASRTREPSPHFQLFWSAAKLEHLQILLLIPKIRGQDSQITLKMMDPHAPTNSSIAFLMALLELAAEESEWIFLWFLECFGYEVVLDLILLEPISGANMSSCSRQLYSSSLLRLALRLLHIDRERCQPLFVTNPRLLQCVINQVYAVKVSIQIAALQLVQELVKGSMIIRQMLFRLDYFSSSLATVDLANIAYVQERLTRLNILPAFRQKDFSKIAHLSQIPFFLDLATSELVKLSMSFIDSRFIEDDAFMIIVGDGRFSIIPEWMYSVEQQGKTNPNIGSATMKHIGEEFTYAAVRKKSDSALIYKVQKDAYWCCTTSSTRKKISWRIVSFLKRSALTNGDTSNHPSGNILSKAIRTLVEDRAEIVRRVAYTKRLPEPQVFAQAKREQLRDTVSLLHQTLLFSDISRDTLACLAIHLGDPSPFSLSMDVSIQAAPLVLVYDEDVQIELREPNQKLVRCRLQRGSLFGFPDWIIGNGGCIFESITKASKQRILVSVITMDALQEHLLDTELQPMLQKIKAVIKEQNIDGLLRFMSSGSQSEEDNTTSVGGMHRYLQRAAISLLSELVTAHNFIQKLQANTWAIETIVEVALSVLEPFLVEKALLILIHIADTDLYCKRLCGVELPLFEVTNQNIPSWANHLQLFIGIIRRFDILLWENNFQILQNFFELQHRVIKHFSIILEHMEHVWSSEYMQTLCTVLTTSADPQIPELVAEHILLAANGRPDFVLTYSCEHALHFDVANALIHFSGRDWENLLHLFCFLSADEDIRNDLWTDKRMTVDAFDEIFEVIASELRQITQPSTSDISDETHRQHKISVICDFVQLFCASDIDEDLDKGHRSKMETKFSILTLLIGCISKYPQERQSILRCIGVICLEDTYNCAIAQQATLTRESIEVTFADLILEAMVNLPTSLEYANQAKEIEAVFLCIQALCSSDDGATTFIHAGVVDIIKRFFHPLSAIASQHHVQAWRAILLMVTNLVTKENCTITLHAAFATRLMAFFARLSQLYANEWANWQLGRLFRDYFRLLADFVSKAVLHDILDMKECVLGTDLIHHSHRWAMYRIRAGKEIEVLNTATVGRLMRLGSNITNAAFAVLANLCQASSIALQLCVQPKILDLIGHVVIELMDTETDTTVRLRFLCLIAEQWEANHRIEALSTISLLKVLKMDALIRICQKLAPSEEAFTYASRLMWLLQLIKTAAENEQPLQFDIKSNGEEISSLLCLVTDNISSTGSERPTRCCLIGILAEIAQCTNNSAELNPDWERHLVVCVRCLLETGLSLQFPDDMTRITSTQEHERIYSSLRWMNDRAYTLTIMKFGVIHQSVRLFRHLWSCISIRNLLSKVDANGFHCQIQRTIFFAAVKCLSVLKRDSDFCQRVRLNALVFITSLVSTLNPCQISVSLEIQVIASYRRQARQHGFLLHALNILVSTSFRSQREVLTAIFAYVTENVLAGAEIEKLRDKCAADLMVILLDLVSGESSDEDDIHEFQLDCLQLFNAIVEYSYVNAMYAADICISKLLKIHAKRTQPIFGMTLLQSFYLITRMVKSTIAIEQDDIWDLLRDVMLDTSANAAWSTVNCCLHLIMQSIKKSSHFITYLVNNWDSCGRAIVQCAIKIANRNEFHVHQRADYCSITENAIQALNALCCVDIIRMKIVSDDSMVLCLLKTLVLTNPLSSSAIELLDQLIRSMPHYIHCALRLRLRKSYEELPNLDTLSRSNFLALFPSVVYDTENGDCLMFEEFDLQTLSQSEIWKGVLECILNELCIETEIDEQATLRNDGRCTCPSRSKYVAISALNAFLRSGGLRHIHTDALTSLRQLWNKLNASLEHLHNELEANNGLMVYFFTAKKQSKYKAPGANLHDLSSLSVFSLTSGSSPLHMHLLMVNCLVRLSPVVFIAMKLAQWGSTCFSLWVAKGFWTAEINYIHTFRELSDVLLCLISQEDSELWQQISMCVPFWRLLVRIVASQHQNSLIQTAEQIMAALLKTPSEKVSGVKSHFLQFIHGIEFDLINTIWWRFQSLPKISVEKGERAIWCSLLKELCIDANVADSLVKYQLLNDLLLIQYHCGSAEENLRSPANENLLSLFATVFQLLHRGIPFAVTDFSTSEMLSDHCARTISMITGLHRVKSHAIEVLYYLSLHMETRPVIYKAYILTREDNIFKAAHVTRKQRLQAHKEMVKLHKEDICILRMVLYVLFTLCHSELGVKPLLYVQSTSAFTMRDVIINGLKKGIGTTQQLLLLPVGSFPLHDPSPFLMPHPPSSLHQEISMSSLHIFRLCLAEKRFFESLQSDIVIFQRLFAALACPVWKVSRLAASALSSAIKSLPHLENVDMELRGMPLGLSQYICSVGLSSETLYRRLAFFDRMDENNRLIKVVPPSPLPSSFILLVRWIQFFSRNVGLDQSVSAVIEHSHATQPYDATAVDNQELQSHHVQHLRCILEVLLYMLTNYLSHAFIFGDNESSKQEKVLHSVLCTDLLRFCKRRYLDESQLRDAIPQDEVIRCRTILLLCVLCSYETHRYAPVIVTQRSNISLLLTIAERTTSEREQLCSAHLLQDITHYAAVKDLFVCNHSLVDRLNAWLENPKFLALQIHAAIIVKNLVTKANSRKKQSIFHFARNSQQQLTRSFFLGTDCVPKNTGSLQSLGTSIYFEQCGVNDCIHQHVNVVVLLIEFHANVVRDVTQFPVAIKVHLQLLNSNECIRELQVKANLHSTSDQLQHEIVVEKDICAIKWKTVIRYGNVATRIVNKFFLRRDGANDTLCDQPEASKQIHLDWKLDDELNLSISIEKPTESTKNMGAIGRLLRRSDDYSPELVSNVTGIVAELCKSNIVFCDSSIRIWSHILAVLGRSTMERVNQKIDLHCLESLSTWFWSKPSVSFFKSSMIPILKLIQHMRQYAFTLPVKSSQRRIKVLQDIMASDRTDALSRQSHSNFLTSLAEWIAGIETPVFTENCINILFMGNADVLLFLCSHIFPQRSARASYFFLVATVVRTNMAHCSLFSRKHAVRLLQALLLDDDPTETEASRMEMLQHAARIVAKISRYPTARDKFLRHGGMNYFKRIAFEIYRQPWQSGQFPQPAAENLVLACSFMCEFLVGCTAVDARDTKHVSFLHQSCEPPIDDLMPTLIETLLLFLGRSTQFSGSCSGHERGRDCLSSFDRLAASLFAAIAEKHPSRVEFGHGLLKTMNNASKSIHLKSELMTGRSCYLAGLKRCLQLTRWDFESELNTIRWTYYTCIREGVRRGILPPPCGNAFMQFDNEFLRRRVEPLLQKIEMQSWSRSGNDQRQNSRTINTTTLNIPEIEDSDSVIRDQAEELLSFAQNHDELLETLKQNHKKTLMRIINVADRNARVMMAIHAILSVALDFFVDLLIAVRKATRASDFFDGKSPPNKMVNTDTDLIVIFQAWLILLEDLGGLVCCGLQNLDPTYYSVLLQQFHSLIFEFPVFLQKMERVRSKKQSVLVFLSNLDNLLKRLTNKIELKGIAANGFSVTIEAKLTCERLRVLHPFVAESLGMLLEANIAADRLARMLVAMDYVWRRIMGSVSLIDCMVTTQETESLWKKVIRYSTKFFSFLLHSGQFFVDQWRKVRTKFMSFNQYLTVLVSRQTPNNVPFQHVGGDDKTCPVNARHAHANVEVKQGTVHTDSLANYNHERSLFPVCSLESLLDHFAFASLGAKKIKQMMALPNLKTDAVRLIAETINRDIGTVEAFSVFQLESQLQSVSPDASTALYRRLLMLAKQTDAGIYALQVDQVPLEVNLWRFLARPVQRLRLFHIYDLAKQFTNGDRNKRKHLLKQHRSTMTTHETIPFSEQASVVRKEILNTHEEPQTLLQKLRLQTVQRHLSVLPTNKLPNDSLVNLEFSQLALRVCDEISSVNPLSEQELIKYFKNTLQNRDYANAQSRSWFKWVFSRCGSYGKYETEQSQHYAAKIRRKVMRMVLYVAFWRCEELELDFKSEILAEVIPNQLEREDYLLSLHVRKAATEFIRIWMPENGTLGLRLWEWQSYSIVGTLLCIGIAYGMPEGCDNDQFCGLMSSVIFVYIVLVFLLSGISIVIIARKRFVLQDRDRIRFFPFEKYYQNAAAVGAIMVDLVQLNSLSFDSMMDPKNDTQKDSNQISVFIGWLDNFGISYMELKALLCLSLLVLWFFVLKAENKFQETNPFLNRILTRDIPSVLNGFLYMTIISSFFSFLVYDDGNETQPWMDNKVYKILGLWGVTFFLPIGLLAHGMNQVLFQQETLDIKYAPVILLFSQLVKAISAMAKVFFPSNPKVLAGTGLAGNATLLLLMAIMKSSSLWYIRFIKCGIYAASCWSAICAIYHTLYPNPSELINIIYLGWLSVAAITATSVWWHAWRRAELKQREEQLQWSIQRQLLADSSSLRRSNDKLTLSEKRFLNEASKRVKNRALRDTFVAASQKLDPDNPPPVLEAFMRRSRALAHKRSSQKFVSSTPDVVFLYNAQILARKLKNNDFQVKDKKKRA